MSLLISHMSALDFWRLAYPTGKAPSVADCAVPNSMPLYSEEDVWSSAPTLITPRLLEPEGGVLHVLVQDPSCRYRSSTHYCHQWSGVFPDASFYRLSESAFVASPEFVFLQLARELSIPQLIALGDELCGSYSFDDREKTGMRQRDVPLTNKEALGSYLELVAATFAASGMAAPLGFRKARRVLEHVVERSASPVETEIEMLLALPCRMGGYGLDRPLMNFEIPLSPEAARIARRNTLRADLCWHNRKLDLEFNGRSSHAGESAALSDRARTNALTIEDYTVIEIANEQVADFRQFDSMALHVAKLLGKRIPSKQRGALPQRMQLRSCLAEWSRRSGRG